MENVLWMPQEDGGAPQSSLGAGILPELLNPTWLLSPCCWSAQGLEAHPEPCRGDGSGQCQGQPAAVATQGTGGGIGTPHLAAAKGFTWALCWPPAMSSQWKEV